MNFKVPLLLKVLVGILLAAWVVSQIQGRDQVVVQLPGGGEKIHYGQILRHPDTGIWHFKGDIHLDNLNAPAKNLEVRPGFFTLLRRARLKWIAWAVGLWGMLVLLAALRWQILLSAAGVQASYIKSLRLCLVGWFFNNVVPGLTGGDLARAVLITKGMTENRWKAGLSVLVDRVVGLVVLIGLAACMLGFLLFGDSALPVENVIGLAKAVFIFLGVAFLFGALYLSRRARGFLGLEDWLKRLPGGSTFGKINEAATIYRERPRKLLASFILSVPLQISGIASFYCVGKALGADLLLAEIFIAFPIAQTLSALPISPPAGWGVGETIYGEFFALFGSTFTLGVAVSVLFRLISQVGFGLLGGIVWMISAERKSGERAQ